MSDDYLEEACVALVSIDLDDSKDVSAYVVGCSSPEETEAIIRQEYGPEIRVEIIVSKLSSSDAKSLRLRPREIRPWQ
ncbi:hypothetical protein [Bradyrhizobium sp. LHD-71]|uniref:hypothetical protein n=1 Tax=Bradyrhizobium sp. LHD-71 TaxID=3072141 RepID=UPI00280F6EB8|nr:hypothetical protein [Bradyrhizobium sp. LHD-71]MDQ8730014.1 hypothetical protein [Bradyrhizobium sp. LHD-71]